MRTYASNLKAFRIRSISASCVSVLAKLTVAWVLFTLVNSFASDSRASNAARSSSSAFPVVADMAHQLDQAHSAVTVGGVSVFDVYFVEGYFVRK